MNNKKKARYQENKKSTNQEKNKKSRNQDIKNIITQDIKKTKEKQRTINQ